MMLSGDPINGWPGLSTGISGDKKSSTRTYSTEKRGTGERMPRQPFNLPIPWWWDAEGAMMGGDDVIGSRTTTMMVRGNSLGMQ